MRNPIPGNPGKLSLLVEILDWLLAPLIILWPLSVVVTFYVANVIANIPYDRALRDSVNALAQHVNFDERRAGVSLPAGASSFLRTDELDTIWFQVRANAAERGSVFTVVFPRAAVPGEAQAAHEAAPRLERRRAA